MKPTLSEKLREIGISRQAYPVWLAMLWRGPLLGTTLLLVLSDDRYRNLRLNLAAYIVAMVWCYYDGMFSRRRWGIAWFEGVLLYVVAVCFANLLGLVFGVTYVVEPSARLTE